MGIADIADIANIALFLYVMLEFCGEAARSKGGDAARRFCEVSHSRDLNRKKHRVTLFFDIFRYYSYLLYNMHIYA